MLLLRLAKPFGVSMELLLRMQAGYDAARARVDVRDPIAIDQEQIGGRAFLDDSAIACVDEGSNRTRARCRRR